MEYYKTVVAEAIKDQMTLMTEHIYSDILSEPLMLEVLPYKIDGEYMICYDILAEQPYAINLKKIIKIYPFRKFDKSIPGYSKKE